LTKWIERFLSFFGSGGFGTLSKLTNAANLGKLTNSLNKLNNTFKSLNSLATLANNLNKLSIAVFANDLTDGSGQKIHGASRFIAGLQTAQMGLGKITDGKFDLNLNAGQLEFLRKVGGNIGKISDYYQKGVMITGKEKIFGGKEVADDERFN